jgi:hypothetical protein
MRYKPWRSIVAAAVAAIPVVASGCSTSSSNGSASKGPTAAQGSDVAKRAPVKIGFVNPEGSQGQSQPDNRLVAFRAR